MKRTPMRRLLLAAPVAAVALSGAAALAQAPVTTKPPAPAKTDTPPTWLYYLSVVALGGATVALSIMPSKRSHQD